MKINLVKVADCMSDHNDDLNTLMDSLASHRLTVIRLAQSYALGVLGELYLEHDGKDSSVMREQNETLLAIMQAMTGLISELSEAVGEPEKKYLELDEMLACVQTPSLL